MSRQVVEVTSRINSIDSFWLTTMSAPVENVRRLAAVPVAAAWSIVKSPAVVLMSSFRVPDANPAMLVSVDPPAFVLMRTVSVMGN